jgi:hypothetical protein
MGNLCSLGNGMANIREYQKHTNIKYALEE